MEHGGGGNRDRISEKVSRSHMTTVQKEGLRGRLGTNREEPTQQAEQSVIRSMRI